MITYIILFSIPSLILICQLLSYNFTLEFNFDKVIIKIIEPVSIIIYPLLFFIYIEQPANVCCGESATFSPSHRFSIYTLIICCQLAYFISSYKKEILSPIMEVLCNCMLILGLILNIVVSYHIEVILSFIGTLPIIILILFQLLKNHRIFFATEMMNPNNDLTSFEKQAYKILKADKFIKYPLLIFLCIPVLIIIICFLMLFHQKPDALIKAFTETYKHGFSEWDHHCENVLCGGHFLCSVAASGHGFIVKPIRYGVRNGGIIVCNRQLLIANAFEDWLYVKFPSLHKIIRNNYNRIGKAIHKYYFLFENKFICDVIYVLMKPAEFIFILILYTFDKRPENRISVQYTSKKF